MDHLELLRGEHLHRLWIAAFLSRRSGRDHILILINDAPDACDNLARVDARSTEDGLADSCLGALAVVSDADDGIHSVNGGRNTHIISSYES